MAYDEHIFDRIDDMVEDMKSDWKTLFLSDDYGSFLSEYAKNLIAGVYDSLRAQGAKIAEGLLESEMTQMQSSKQQKLGLPLTNLRFPSMAQVLSFKRLERLKKNTKL